jgi:5-methyltetrahydrofolate--homocysteine methyltransferase
MKTVLKSQSQEVVVSTDGPIVMIGEKINPTGRKKLAAALQAGDFEYVKQQALQQAAFGAHVLDVNVSVPGLDEKSLLPAVVKFLTAHTQLPLCLDSNNPQALAAALEVAPGKPLVNSVSGEEGKLRDILPVVKDRGAAVIGLTMDNTGIPADAEARLAIAGKIIERAAKAGIPAEDVLIDPLVLSVGADQKAAAVTLKTIALVRREFGVNINLGASNVSFGLPDRQTVNQAFLALAFGAGASCVITDAEKLAGAVLASDLLLGRDPYGKRYLIHVRRMQAAAAAAVAGGAKG